MTELLRTRRSVLGQVIEHARRQPNQECCGLLAGSDGVITEAFPARNAAKDPNGNYEIAPLEIVRLLREFRQRNLRFLGIYHSHPNGENAPSPKDVELAYYSEAAYFIVTPRPYAEKPIRAFSIRDGSTAEFEIDAV